jgi:uncharacterized protein YijF (DUF1287 family)
MDVRTFTMQTLASRRGSTRGEVFSYRAMLTAAAVAVSIGLLPALSASAVAQPATREGPEPGLGITDRGIFSDLDARVRIAVPAHATRDNTHATIDSERRLLILYVDGWPSKPYPLTGDATLTVAGIELSLRPNDRRELAPLLTDGDAIELSPGDKRAFADRDDDGIPDPLDLLLGAHKTALNRASYGAGYIKLAYPGGDVPREVGVCTDVVVRATRNAGLDIQPALHRDIRRSPRSYPMVKGKGNRNIDHRRVKTLLPYFKRHWNQRSKALNDAADPLRPGDVVFMDTFPSRRGPDHIGVVSDRLGASGLPLIINNWTDGTVTAEMDLLEWVPVTHRFRL